MASKQEKPKATKKKKHKPAHAPPPARSSSSSRRSGKRRGRKLVINLAIGEVGVHSDVLSHLNDKERLGLSALGQDKQAPGNPPAWVADEAIWTAAKRQVLPHWKQYAQPYAVVAHVYDLMGGRHT